MPDTEFPRGSLAVVATPLGNPADITLRAIATLRAADLVAAEDTRTARRLLAAHGISKPLVSYHEWNEAQRAEALLGKLEEGARVALVSEAGTPGLSDPGFDLVRLARRRGIRVFPVPGPSALVSFLSVSGLPTDAFSFFGFPPSRSAARKKLFHSLAARPETLIFYESPRRILDALRDAVESLGDRPAALGREMTKPHEEFLFGPLSEVHGLLSERTKVLGEICWGVAGSRGEDRRPEEHALQEEIRQLLARGLPLREAARVLVTGRTLSVKEAYAMLLAAKGKG
ncbi:MAG: 16S rRNA (cytidine(1402)-2'-O)-methyltransferase [Deltaproteobacteria bacterium]|nr:16S rRNA (cytidine(1402)-2'-O)-methyltransferase [Deltaproteobacteria bacterium]